MLYSCIRMATVGVKGLKVASAEGVRTSVQLLVRHVLVAVVVCCRVQVWWV